VRSVSKENDSLSNRNFMADPHLVVCDFMGRRVGRVYR
jgi:hypothetical protein